MYTIEKIIDEPFRELVTVRWFDYDLEFREKYQTYRSKYLKAQESKSEGIGIGKKIEMLYEARYEILILKPVKK